MFIGELARRAGISVQAVRLYERRGLMRKAARSASGYRQYTDADLTIVQTVKKCQRFGLTLAETRQVLTLFAVPDRRTGKTRYPAGSHDCLAEVAEIGARKLRALDEKIDELRALRKELEEVLRQIRAKLPAASVSR